YPEARAIFDQADRILGVSLSRLCLDGPEDQLTDTVNAQPAILVTSIATLRMIEKHAPHIKPAFVAGHSLGEFSALVATGSLSFEDAVRLVRERGRVMKAAGAAQPGVMAAILNLGREVLDEVCKEASTATGQPVQVANDNSPGQIVISGDVTALDKAMELAKARGAKRAIKLAVSIAAHSPLMQPAARSFRKTLDATKFGSMTTPIIGNVYARPLDLEDVRDELEAQLTSPVRWTESIQYLAEQGVTTCIEIGPKDVLTGLMRRIDPTLTAMSVGDPTGIQLLLEK
ncbi:MAG TPA: ACP S-malonyltransferase, partial [Anaerolineae bacterium]|nr:ACP S-malonyltransferase [Anaerolineae bacterium]